MGVMRIHVKGVWTRVGWAVRGTGCYFDLYADWMGVRERFTHLECGET